MGRFKLPGLHNISGKNQGNIPALMARKDSQGSIESYRLKAS